MEHAQETGHTRIVVIGGGPAGLMAAITARREGAEVLLLEKTDEPGRKLLLTGHGRCNITNLRAAEDLPRYYFENGRFLTSAFSTFPPEQARAFFREIGVPTHEEEDGRVFPDAQKALAVRDALVRAAEQEGVSIRTGFRVTSILKTEKQDMPWRITSSDEVLFADGVILTTGGASFVRTGSEGDGYALAGMAGHTVTARTPALAPIFLSAFTAPAEEDSEDMAGLSLSDIGTSLWVQDKKVASARGDLLFTHQGVSGPSIMALTRKLPLDEALYRDEKVRLEIDFLPALREEEVEKKLLDAMTENPNRHMKRILCETFSLKEKIAEMLPAMENPANQVTRETRRKIVRGLKASAFAVAKCTPLDMAYVTCGGVCVKEVSPKTMESKKAPGLFLAGEVLDVDGASGGFNLQCAWATGYVAGRAAGQMLSGSDR